MALPTGTDSFVQVAVDSTGKKVVMNQVTMPDGTTAYVQVAVLAGDAPDLLARIDSKLTDLLAVMRALLAVQQNTTNLQIAEDDYRPL